MTIMLTMVDPNDIDSSEDLVKVDDLKINPVSSS